jgi:D-threo-aldose 1-dehydrogenase
MRPEQRKPVGRTTLEITQFGVGGTAFGNIYNAIADDQATATIDAAIAAGLTYFDTAPLYGFGLSETRLGQGLARHDRNQVVISTKVGWRLEPLAATEENASLFRNAPRYRQVMDYSRDTTLRSIEASLNRLQTDRIDILLMHDPDEGITTNPGRDNYEISHFVQAMKETYPVLDDLRRQGVVKAIGLGMNQWPMLWDFAHAGDFDCFLLAGRYTLLEQAPLRRFLPMCVEKGISIIVGGPFNSGILAVGARPDAYYNYLPAPTPMLERVRRIEAVCARHGVALPAAALLFPLGHPAVAAIIPGARSAVELQTNLTYFRQQIPADFWAELKHLKLIDPESPVPAEHG